MAAVIRLQRGGRKKQPHYSVVVTDKRNPRDGSFIERLGYYDPCSDEDTLKLDMERVNYWLSRGAQPSSRAAGLITRASSENQEKPAELAE
ncbi:MAG: 30S ribosomal protein S16 [Mariprofundales bacterium]